MSLLLDALKKAALEKQRREQLGGAQSGSAALNGAVQHKIESASPSPVNNISPLHVTPVVPLQAEVATAQVVADLQMVDMQLVNLAVAKENVKKIIDDDEPLIFNIDEIDNEYLVSPLPQTQKIEAQEIDFQIIETKNAETKNAEIQDTETQNLETLETKTQELYQEMVLETIRKASHEQAPVQENQEVKVQDTGTLNPEIHVLENEMLKTPVPEIHVQETQRSEPQNFESKISESLPIIETNVVEQFNPTAGKAALAQLLLRSKKATEYARKRILIMYALLTLTAFTVLVVYYYLLQSNSASVVMPQQLAAVNPPVETPGGGAVSEETVSVETLNPTEAPEGSDISADSKAESLTQPKAFTEQQASTEKGTLGAAIVQPTHSQPDQLNSTSTQETKPLVKERVLPAVATDQSVRNSEALPPEFVTKQGIIAYQKSTENVVSEAIERGYNAYQRGDLLTAKAAYREALEQDPHQRDGLLGAAAVAVRENRQQDALGFYQQRLARDPKDDYAQAGILALSANGEQNLQLESELTRLLREFPNASHLHFLQGSLFAARQQWEAAQFAFFEAWQRDTKNPDLAFNLAIALDHLNQPKEAARFYQQALTLSGAHPVSFSKEAVDRRLKELVGDAKPEGASEPKDSQP